MSSTEQRWTDADDRALQVEAAWQAHVRAAMEQAMPAPKRPDHLDEMVTREAQAMSERHAVAHDAVRRRNAFVFEAVALMSLMFAGAVVAIVVTAVTR